MLSFSITSLSPSPLPSTLFVPYHYHHQLFSFKSPSLPLPTIFISRLCRHHNLPFLFPYLSRLHQLSLFPPLLLPPPTIFTPVPVATITNHFYFPFVSLPSPTIFIPFPVTTITHHFYLSDASSTNQTKTRPPLPSLCPAPAPAPAAARTP